MGAWARENSDKLLVLVLTVVMLAIGASTNDPAIRQGINSRVDNLVGGFLTLVTGGSLLRRAPGAGDPPPFTKEDPPQ